LLSSQSDWTASNESLSQNSSVFSTSSQQYSAAQQEGQWAIKTFISADGVNDTVFNRIQLCQRILVQMSSEKTDMTYSEYLNSSCKRSLSVLKPLLQANKEAALNNIIFPGANRKKLALVMNKDGKQCLVLAGSLASQQQTTAEYKTAQPGIKKARQITTNMDLIFAAMEITGISIPLPDLHCLAENEAPNDIDLHGNDNIISDWVDQYVLEEHRGTIRAFLKDPATSYFKGYHLVDMFAF
ncbi:MAG: hypothetical protein ACPGUD_14590, partial [Parashewanella sp.]